jgi:hypothetical protein
MVSHLTRLLPEHHSDVLRAHAFAFGQFARHGMAQPMEGQAVPDKATLPQIGDRLAE